MELPSRDRNDIYLPDGALTALLRRLQERKEAHDLRIAIFYAYDYSTRMLPYWYADKRMAPCSVRTLADSLSAAGFRHVRVVLQQWNPRVRPSLCELDGRPVDLLLVSSMQVHASRAYDLVRDAHRAGPNRPLIIAGGPKAIYEPTDYFDLGPEPGVGADCVVTGEVFVLLSLLDRLLEDRGARETLRDRFEQVRNSGELSDIPGLVYLDPDMPVDEPVAVNTGVQRLLRSFDELPMPDAGYRVLEAPHRGQTMRAQPCPAHKVRRYTPIASLQVTQGCRFHCPYCPIPAANQKTRRSKSPERLAAEVRHIYEQFGINSFFGTDDNYFNSRETVVGHMTALANERTSDGRRLGDLIAYATEATQLDVYRNRDILPLCAKAGMRALWFGIEDLTAALVKKGQNAAATNELFDVMWKLGIEANAMLIHSDEQPLETPHGDLRGLLNQARYLFERGATSYQCTYLGPAVGTRDIEPALQNGAVFRRVGGERVPQAYQDGNHVAASRHPRPWRQQINLLQSYATFYNPVNLVRTIFELRKGKVGRGRLIFQIAGHIGLVMTVPKLLRWAWRLKRGPIEVYHGAEPARVPMVSLKTGREMSWAVQYGPSPRLATRALPSRPVRSTPIPATSEVCC